MEVVTTKRLGSAPPPNKRYGQCHEIVPDPELAVALFDRLPSQRRFSPRMHASNAPPTLRRQQAGVALMD